MSEEPFNIKLYPLEVFKSDKIVFSNFTEILVCIFTVKHECCDYDVTTTTTEVSRNFS